MIQASVWANTSTRTGGDAKIQWVESLVGDFLPELMRTAFAIRPTRELECWAQAELRSVNGQIEYILRQAVNKRKGERTIPPPVSEEQK
jgi:hypothetical protein